ncbi:MAG: rod shape-determining protein MreD [Bacillota bacterium]|nr:rod shape-determining protein MreD [Bacillota bacterium]
MTVFFNILIFTAAYLLDTAKMFKFMSVFGISPNIVFVCVVCFCIFYGKERGLVLAIGMGLALDIVTAYPFGANALLFMAMVVICAITYDTIFERNLITTVVMVFVLSLGYNLLKYIFELFLSGEYNFLYVLWRYILPASVYNTLISPIVYWVVGKVYYRNERIF